MNAEEFWSRIQKGDGCWTWPGSTDGRYGEVWFDGRKKKAHRLAYELAVGPIPRGMHVLHSCDNPPCVRPAHLHLGTHAENMREMVERNRVFRTPLPATCPQGHPHNEANTYTAKNGRRHCRVCAVERNKRRRHLRLGCFAKTGLIKPRIPWPTNGEANS